MKKTLLLLLLLPFCFAAAAEGAIDRAWVERNYRKTEYRIPMRDGVRLHTTVYAPCDTERRRSYGAVRPSTLRATRRAGTPFC